MLTTTIAGVGLGKTHRTHRAVGLAHASVCFKLASYSFLGLFHQRTDLPCHHRLCNVGPQYFFTGRASTKQIVWREMCRIEHAKPSRYRGTQGTAIVRIFERTAAMTGDSEKVLQRAKRPYRKVYVHPTHHAGYYPGAEGMTLKLPVRATRRKNLGCPGHWRDKRIDVLAVAIQGGMTVFDLEETELPYSPQYGSAKDPINMA